MGLVVGGLFCGFGLGGFMCCYYAWVCDWLYRLFCVVVISLCLLCVRILRVCLGFI